MALNDTVNEDLDEDLDSDSDSDSDSDEESFQEKSDRLYRESFGAGKFVPNQYGSMTFVPDARKMAASAGARPTPSPFTSPAAIDPNSMQLMRRPQMSLPPQQIRRLSQLAGVAKRIKGLPPEWQKRIIAHLFGQAYQDPQQSAMQRALAIAQFRNQLGAGDRAERAQRAQQALELRAQRIKDLQKDSTIRNKRAKAVLDFRRENAKSMRELHHMNALNTINRSIANLTKASELADESTKQKMLDHVAKLHKIAEKYEKMFLPEEDETNSGESEGGSSGSNQSGSSGSDY